MKRVQGTSCLWAWILVLAFVSLLTGSVSAQSSDVLGEVQFEGMTNVEKTSGVWFDGQYVGYLKELKASKKVLLLPGEPQFPCVKMGTRTLPRQLFSSRGKRDIDVGRFYRDLESCRSKSAWYISSSYMRDRFLV